MMGVSSSRTAIFSFFALLAMSFVLAYNFLPVSVTVNEQVSNNYSVRVNNTDIGVRANITIVNVTIPPGFSFLNNSNATGAPNSAFTNTTNSTGWTTLMWSNRSATISLVNNISGTPNNVTFSFNATANTTTIGNFTFIVRVQNATTVTSYVYNVTVNDTSRPSAISFVAPSSNMSNVTTLQLNVSAADNHNVSAIRYTIYDSDFDLVNSTNVSANGASTSAAINVTSFTDGLYYVNATAVDSNGNVNTSSVISFVLDKTAPSVSIAHSSEATRIKIAATVSSSDALSGIVSCNLNSIDSSPQTWTSSSQLITESSSRIECGRNFTRIATCTDYAGNSGTASASLGTDDCVTFSSSSSSSGTAWKLTYAHDSSALVSISRSLAAKERIRFLVNKEKHTVGILSISGNSAMIEVASTPQTASMQIGEIRKFDTNADGYYDVEVVLNGISGEKVSLSVRAINEIVEQQEEQASSASSSSGDQPGETLPAAEEGDSARIWVWLIILAAIGGAIHLVMRKMRKHRRVKQGYEDPDSFY